MSSETTALSEMGVINADQIIGYSLVQASVDTDTIRINYKRPAKSLLPRRRMYEFKRIGKPIRGKAQPGEDLIRYEISPILRRAVDEIEALLGKRSSKRITKEQIQAEIKELEAEMGSRLAHISQLVEEMNAD